MTDGGFGTVKEKDPIQIQREKRDGQLAHSYVHETASEIERREVDARLANDDPDMRDLVNWFKWVGGK